jgi:hypothetical protein
MVGEKSSYRSVFFFLTFSPTLDKNNRYDDGIQEVTTRVEEGIDGKTSVAIRPTCTTDYVLPGDGIDRCGDIVDPVRCVC